MIHDQIEFFNVAELRDGVLYRFPLDVCDHLRIPEYDAAGRELRIHTGHRASARASCGIELRFVTDAKEVTFCYEAQNSIQCTAYNGDFQSAYQIASPGRNEMTITREREVEGVKKASENRFSKDVWRIAVSGEGDIRFLGLKTEKGEAIRPPRADECPRIRLLAYGSSISQGIGALYPPLNYLNTAAQVLGIDIINKAIAGGCFCERETIDYLTGERCDAVYLEPGTNIADRPLAVIESRVGGLIDTFCEKFPEKKIFIMTPIRGLSDVSDTALDYREKFPRSREVICRHAEKYPNAVLLDGHQLLDKDYYLASDILHPSDFGHVMMGINFANMLRPYLKP